MAKILGLPFDDYVKGQIGIRQIKLAKSQKSPEDLVVFNSNTSWVRLTSGVEIDPAKAKILSEKLNILPTQIQGNALAKNLVLWGGVSSFSSVSGSDVTLDLLKGGVGYGINNAYGFLSGPEQGLKPFPGIENITCNYKNNGSLKQAQVKLKCFTRSQFEALEAIYLRLGYTLVLEWGNVNYFNNKGEFSQVTKYEIPNILFKSEGNVDPDTIQNKLYSNKQDTYGNYDGMLAKVSNFSWQLNNDLSFDITLDLISVGDIIDSLKANIGGISNTNNLMTKVDVSGSIQNIVSIQINSNASRINAFLADLYDEVYKSALQSWQVSPDTQIAVKQANEVVKDLESGDLDKIKNKYKNALLDFYSYYNSFLKLEFPENKGINRVGLSTDPKALETRKKFYPNRRDDEVFSDFDEMISNYSDEKKYSADKYKASLDAISTAIENVKVGGGELYYALIDPSNTDIKESIKFALNTKSNPTNAIGNAGKYGRVEGTTFKDGGTFTSYNFSKVIASIFNIKT